MKKARILPFDAMTIMVTNEIHVDGFGKGKLLLVAYRNGAATRFQIELLMEREAHVLRRFPHLLKAVRSYRRFILLSDEVTKGGYGV